VAPAALAYVYCDQEDVECLLSVVGEERRLDDDGTGTVSATESGYLTKIIGWASGRINFHCQGRYEPSQLALSWTVNDWATIISCYVLACRRGSPPPGILAELYEKAMEDLKLVQAGDVGLPDVASRTESWPSWSSITFDAIAPLRKARVQRGLSERRRGGGAEWPDRAIHFPSDYLTGPYV
jgi:hypothetical protein